MCIHLFSTVIATIRASGLQRRRIGRLIISNLFFRVCEFALPVCVGRAFGIWRAVALLCGLGPPWKGVYFIGMDDRYRDEAYGIFMAYSVWLRSDIHGRLEASVCYSIDIFCLSFGDMSMWYKMLNYKCYIQPLRPQRQNMLCQTASPTERAFRLLSHPISNTRPTKYMPTLRCTRIFQIL